jgi:hypothetical protein
MCTVKEEEDPFLLDRCRNNIHRFAFFGRAAFLMNQKPA